jgi:hypothetical protein
LGDVAFATLAINALGQFGRIAPVGRTLYNVLLPYLRILTQQAQNENLEIPLAPQIPDPETLEFPYRMPTEGSSNLHKGARDLVRILCRPFGSDTNDTMAWSRSPGAASDAGEIRSSSFLPFEDHRRSFTSDGLLSREQVESPTSASTQSGGRFSSAAKTPGFLLADNVTTSSELIIREWVEDMVSWYATHLELYQPFTKMDTSY